MTFVFAPDIHYGLGMAEPLSVVRTLGCEANSKEIS